jgi:hypothetical protein
VVEVIGLLGADVVEVMLDVDCGRGHVRGRLRSRLC